MSILAKKMSTQSSVPATYAALGDQLNGFHTALLETIKTYSPIRLKEGLANVMAGPFSTFCEGADGQAPCFLLGTKEHTNLAIIQISVGLANKICAQKLGAKIVAGEKPKPLGLLDLVLLQPNIDKMLTALKDELGEGASNLRLINRFLGIGGVAGIDDSEKWVRVHLPFVPKDEGAEAPPEMGVDLFLSSFMADSVSMALGADGGRINIDPSDPWASHMHSTVLQSSLPLKVIVEVLNMSVADCTRLELGQTLTLPGASHKHLSVSTETRSGLVSLASSTLGVAKSNKAVKLLDDIDPDFLSDMGTILQA